MHTYRIFVQLELAGSDGVVQTTVRASSRDEAERLTEQWLEAGVPATPADLLAQLERLWPTWGTFEREEFANALLTRLAH